MEYNTQKEKLIIKEYGRNVQKLVRFATAIKDAKERNDFVQGIISIMGQMNPHLRNVDEYRHKLWDHLFLISDFKLDADSPFPKPGKQEDILPKIKTQVPYPKTHPKYKHYGKNVETLIARAKTFEDKDKQKEFVDVIANYMKMAYMNWNGDNVNDVLIKGDLARLSGNELEVGADSNLDSLAISTRHKRPKPPPRQGGGGVGYQKKFQRRRNPR